ncbi:hypothetical protein [Comamonas humi]
MAASIQWRGLRVGALRPSPGWMFHLHQPPYCFKILQNQQKRKLGELLSIGEHFKKESC